MLVNGQAIADKIKSQLIQRVSTMDSRPVLAIVMVGDNPASNKYVSKKQKLGESIGVEIRMFEYETSILENELASEVIRLVESDDIQGIIVQLPLPDHIDTQKILNLVPGHKDIDALGEDARVLSPVVGSIEAIFNYYQVNFNDKKVVVVGKGRLVGWPVAVWLAGLGVQVEAVDSGVQDLAQVTKQADVLILGAGRPHLIKPDMIKEGVVMIDAGTSEDANRLLGDADPTCASRASLFTPVPGGVGPLTVVMLFKNLIDLAQPQF